LDEEAAAEELEAAAADELTGMATFEVTAAELVTTGETEVVWMPPATDVTAMVLQREYICQKTDRSSKCRSKLTWRREW
jgi:hypothetical protein